MTWTHFHDMHSGGGQKLEWAHIYIEQPEPEAKVVFFKRFGRNPERVTCTCCGEDYSISSDTSLAQLTGYARGCRSLKTPRDANGRYKQPDDPWFAAHYYLEDGEQPKPPYEVDESPIGTLRIITDGYQTLDQYCARSDVKIIRAAEISPDETRGEVPKEGYVWAGEP